MSGISLATDYAFGSQLIANATNVKAQYDTLTEQSSTGLISQTLGGLGAGVGTALNLGTQIAQISVTQSNITAATTQIQTAQSVMTQLTSIAQQFETSATQLGTTSSVDIDALASQAQDALGEVATLLNTQSNGQYLFSGQDTGNPAVPDATNMTTSSFYTAINAAVNSTAQAGYIASYYASQTPAITAADASSAEQTAAGAYAVTQMETAATTAATGNSPFSTTLAVATSATPVPTVAGANGQQVGIGILASVNSVAVSPTPTSTPSSGSSLGTGSYMLDLMTNLAMLASLGDSQGTQPGIPTLAANISTNLQSVVSGLSTDAGALGAKQNLLTDQSTQLSDVSTALSAQLSNVQDVDPTTVATRLSEASTQLQASYQLIANLKNMSLVNFL